jgi:undecaprenyl-diphosphatase
MRPFVGGEVDPFSYSPFLWRPDYAGMPSGHTTTAFAAAAAIGLIWPRLRPLLWVYAPLIALSRIMVGAHYPSDVLVAAVVGVAGALLVRNWLAARNLGFAVGADGSVHTLPGPSFARVKKVAGRLFAP